MKPKPRAPAEGHARRVALGRQLGRPAGRRGRRASVEPPVTPRAVAARALVLALDEADLGALDQAVAVLDGGDVAEEVPAPSSGLMRPKPRWPRRRRATPVCFSPEAPPPRRRGRSAARAGARAAAARSREPERERERERDSPMMAVRSCDCCCFVWRAAVEAARQSNIDTAIWASETSKVFAPTRISKIYRSGRGRKRPVNREPEA